VIRGAQLGHYLDPEIVAPPMKIAKSTAKPDELISNPKYET